MLWAFPPLYAPLRNCMSMPLLVSQLG